VEKKCYGYKITIDVRSSNPGAMHVLYEDCCQTLDGLRCLLDHVKVEMSKDDSDSETDSDEETGLEEEVGSDEVEMNSGEEEMDSDEETDSDEFAEDQDDEDEDTDADYQPKFITSALRTSHRNTQPQ
jgi:hypothetical protein